MPGPTEKAIRSTVTKGGSSEKLAADYLIAKGYKIVKTNFRYGKLGELDIVAEKGNDLVFVEVRSRYSPGGMDPLLSIGAAKQKNLRTTASGYLSIIGNGNRDCRFDVVIVDFSAGQAPVIDHYENAM